jgi:hypothetical protein
LLSNPSGEKRKALEQALHIGIGRGGTKVRREARIASSELGAKLAQVDQLLLVVVLKHRHPSAEDSSPFPSPPKAAAISNAHTNLTSRHELGAKLKRLTARHNRLDVQAEQGTALRRTGRDADVVEPWFIALDQALHVLDENLAAALVSVAGEVCDPVLGVHGRKPTRGAEKALEMGRQFADRVELCARAPMQDFEDRHGTSVAGGT